MYKRYLAIVICILVILSLSGCGDSNTSDIKVSNTFKQTDIYKRLVEAYAQDTGNKINTIGLDDTALANDIQNGDFSAAIYYDNKSFYPQVYQGQFTVDGLFYDTLVLIGPASDPVGIRQLSDYTIVQVLQHISKTSKFVHAPDTSVLGMRELSIWKSANIVPQGLWYIYASDSEAELIKTTAETGGYALMDRQIFEKLKADYPDVEEIQSGLKGMTDQFCIYTNGEKRFCYVAYGGNLTKRHSRLYQ